MDADRIEAAITPRTKALLPVHLNGRVAAMDQIMSIARRHRISRGGRRGAGLGPRFNGQMAGSTGLAGCFSFYPFKGLGGFGDGGAAHHERSGSRADGDRLRYNGEDRETGEYHYHGHTALLDNVQAAVLSVKLRHLPAWIEASPDDG